MKNRSFYGREMIQFLKIVALIFCILVFSCQNKKATKTMSEENTNKQQADSGRLLSIANLEPTDSGRKIVTWFFETPQVFEFSLDAENAQQFYKLLKEAKENQWPVNVHSSTIQDKNIIDMITPATEEQIKQYNKEKAGRQQPKTVPPPQHN
jgi:hypothetical protein